MQPTRREFLFATGSAAVTAGFFGLQRVFAVDRAATTAGGEAVGYGPLQADPEGRFKLPEGFSYRIISQRGDTMDDGLRVPAKHDGMAAFAGPNGKTILVRNHEVSAGATSHGAFGDELELLEKVDRALLYDAGKNGAPACGGTTTLIYNTDEQRLESHFLSLNGTLRNCAGGPTPWNSWITCEETNQRADDAYAQDHGYNFEVPATTKPGLADPAPLKAMGRFNHEAVAVEPDTGIVYQTEDRGDGLLYRFVPDKRGKLRQGGKLQALKVIDRPSLDTRNWPDDEGNPTGPRIEQSAVMDVQWIDLEDLEAPDDDLRHRGFEAGAARFARGEGMWYGKGSVFFACTNGGRKQKGQIWRYVPSRFEGTADEHRFPGRLELFVEPNDRTLIENADNITVAPWGDLIVCEDGSGEDFLVGITPTGRCYKLMQNVTNASELAGATFAPDGSTLFVNVQAMGITLAITGPWSKRVDEPA